MKIRGITCVLAVCLLLLQAGVADAAKAKTIARFTCVAVNQSGSGRTGNSGFVNIVIERWSTDAEREMLRGTLIDKGSDALLSAVQKIRPRVGYIKLPNTVGWDLSYARDVQRDDGTRQVILATDRPIAFGEVTQNTRSLKYDFTIVDIRFDAEGKGKGELAGAALVTYNQKTNSVEIENYSSRPIDLINVKVEKP